MSGAPQTRTTNGRAEGEEEEGNGKEEASAAASSVAARYLLLLFSSLDSDERGFSRGGAADSGGGAAEARGVGTGEADLSQGWVVGVVSDGPEKISFLSSKVGRFTIFQLKWLRGELKKEEREGKSERASERAR